MRKQFFQFCNSMKLSLIKLPKTPNPNEQPRVISDPKVESNNHHQIININDSSTAAAAAAAASSISVDFLSMFLKPIIKGFHDFFSMFLKPIIKGFHDFFSMFLKDPIIVGFHKKEISKYVLPFSISIGVGLKVTHDLSQSLSNLTVFSLCVGVASILTGILFNVDLDPKPAIVFELIGVASVLLSFFAFLASFLPKEVAWILGVFWVCSLYSFIYAFVSTIFTYFTASQN